MFLIKEKTRSLLEANDYVKSFQIMKDSISESSLSIKFCQICCKIQRAECVGHACVDLDSKRLKYPSKILNPKSQDKKEAQYFFSDSTVKFLTKSVSKLKFTHVICVGCPTIYENLQEKLRRNSLLLDIDARWGNFYDESQFLWTNFFNGHFFRGESRTTFQNFLINADRLLIVVDPPFGAKSELIHHCLSRIKDQLAMLNMNAKVNLMWVFPYFMERQVIKCDKNLIMSDYRVTYAQHVQYGETDQARKLGSPIRLFTDIPLSAFELPSPEYHHCQKCQVWRHVSNIHCDKCGTCPSKDGKTYVHCTICKRCVKPTYEHCHVCGRCALPSHSCPAQATENVQLKENQTATSRKLKKRKRNPDPHKKFKFRKHMRKS